MSEKGILVACDEKQEWLLSWWWENYREDNGWPVAFADLGMSREARSWCAARGQLLALPKESFQVKKREEIDPLRVRQWEESLSPCWPYREAWFKKPVACLASPFEKTIWLDLDCEVLGSIDPLFSYIDPISQMGMFEVREGLYNTGVIAFEKSSPLLPLWREAALKRNGEFISDQEALSGIIFERGLQVGLVPEIYNWRLIRGISLNAVIIHWAAEWGKEYIRTFGGIKRELRSFQGRIRSARSSRA